ncbi:diacylglycerol/lipid kinase family protein [Pseudoblastomonas halimionae]|uniref:Diacylglycerol kinase n=1 Tax=Alteriqipengyuania halimionae TaxID=1926630 RepID=A0A6I4U4C3_9SPHN|nr:diacylglycerol kinase family protein [Alteriqipengyuania halimionae]MXP10818.1 diacylglycerol kinase [Alteriqipengyuania halimionae]
MSRSFTLVVNCRSGSYDRDVIDAILASASELGCGETREIRIPEDDCPSPEDLETDEMLAVFAGDGTVNATISGLYGWDGAILILPGGTMNLLSKRLHGDVDWQTILERVSRGDAQRTRPNIVRTACGDAFAGVMAGPGTSWNEVREAMRDIDVAGVASGTLTAFGETTGGARIAIENPEVGRREGYPMIEVFPSDKGMHLQCYHADDAGEFLVQLGALVTRDFRNGPHDKYGPVETLEFVANDGEPIGLMLDGEPVPAGPREELTVAPCEVDLLATVSNG